MKNSRRPAAPAVTVRKARKPHEGWELAHPLCAKEREEDLAEVRAMLNAGEIDVAVDELRWLLDGCPDFIEAHRLLGEIALAEGDVKLARGHFGYAYYAGEKALARSGHPRPLPFSLPANQAFLESAKGLAWCLRELGLEAKADDVLQTLLECDPDDPLGVK